LLFVSVAHHVVVRLQLGRPRGRELLPNFGRTMPCLGLKNACPISPAHGGHVGNGQAVWRQAALKHL
jgi:hypothetical protein